MTTAGSGTISDYSYNAGLANFTAGNTEIIGVLGTTKWLSAVGRDSSGNVLPGYVIQSDSTADPYAIVTVYDDNHLVVSAPVAFNQTNAAYHIIGHDVPAYPPANVIDRLPVLSNAEDSKGRNEAISTLVTDTYPTLNTRVISEIQDVTGLPPNSLNIGVASADRGRSGLAIAGAKIGTGMIGLKFEKLDATASFHKTYQSYIVESQPGRLQMMVVGSESDNTSAYGYFDPIQGIDTVDLFELPGRPIRNP